nr:HAMP domain-containing sensor histidine kinase [Planobispora siamensis]
MYEETRRREAELHVFAGVVAHDLKRPLTTIQGFSEMVHQDIAQDPGQERNAECLERVTRAAGQMSRLIDDLLTYATARDTTLNCAAVDLNALVREIVDEHVAGARAEAGPVPQVHIDQLPVVHADLPLVRQLLGNLIGNAIKYTRPGHPAHLDITATTVATDKGRARIEIADRGIGIPPGEHKAIFTGFHRAAAAYSGTGLGLAICQRVVERHGGTITASDNPGGGARFTFTLPAVGDPRSSR